MVTKPVKPASIKGERRKSLHPKTKFGVMEALKLDAKINKRTSVGVSDAGVGPVDPDALEYFKLYL